MTFSLMLKAYEFPVGTCKADSPWSRLVADTEVQTPKDHGISSIRAWGKISVHFGETFIV